MSLRCGSSGSDLSCAGGVLPSTALIDRIRIEEEVRVIQMGDGCLEYVKYVKRPIPVVW
jgi:hypothetical protein